MKRVATPHYAETKAKRSKFLAFLVPMDRFEKTKTRLRAEHPKASHIVWAYRKRNEHGHIIENSSDDGEPKGCAGKPLLHVMRGNDLIASAIFVVRYFGGIKLGTGGMARAYGEAAKRVVSAAELIPYEEFARITFHTPYARMSQWEHRIGKLANATVERDFEPAGATWHVRASKSEIAQITAILQQERIDFLIK
ncbi:IMPACT family protein [Hydrogenimonas urashimensis]|uniref:IMPACT family protein n=1 Tax=Hydrogenimonas urashimensis TaxID=2740515 RepID=UPI00191647E6|nr:YigZ family protein [Hydrogenimonas urashimensis]